MADTSSIAAQNAQFIKDQAAGATTKTITGAAADQSALTGDLDFFLKMLTTQLKQQDPSQPMDVNQMTQQIAMLSGVQQQVATNTNLEKLLAQGNSSLLSTAVSYIGNEVETKGNKGQILQGQGAFAYILPTAAKEVKITIKNSVGSVVFEGSGTTQSGRNVVIWDGKNSSTKKQEPDGTYTISVSAKDTNGKAITAETRSVGVVGGVQTDKNGKVQLTVGDQTLYFEDVLALRAPTRTALSSSIVSLGNPDSVVWSSTANPNKFTLTIASHGLKTGDKITLAGFKGIGATPAAELNGVREVTVVDSSHVTISVTTPPGVGAGTTWGSYGQSADLAPPAS
jgi:flagellar basal-body rod modification protein FlgD